MRLVSSAIGADRSTPTVGFLAALALALAATLTGPGTAGAVDLVSRALNGLAGNSASRGVSLNRDGSIVAFYSDATNLVVDDRAGLRDVFVWDAGTGALERVSVSSTGEPGNRDSHLAGGAPDLSGDGNVVAFYSDATNLVDGDNNGHSDVFVRIRDLGVGSADGVTEIVSVDSAGNQGNGPSLFPSISADGRVVAFQSLATNLIADDTNAAADIFVHDRETNTTERACDSVEPNRFSFAPALSADGNSLAFASAATNLVAGDTNGAIDIFVCTRNRGDGTFANGTLERVSLSTAGAQGNADSIVPAISGSGCFVAFKSEADNLVPDDRNHAVDVFVRVRGADVTELISARDPFAGSLSDGASANDGSFPPSISWNGRFVAFGSFATNLLVGDVNQFASVYVRDRLTDEIRLVDVNANGEQANAGTPDSPPSISGDARWIGFVSAAGNLTPPGVDLNFTNDVFRAANPLEPVTIDSVCCECEEDICVDPEDGICPTGCVPVCDAVCSDPGEPGSMCIPLTPPTATPTATATTTPATPTFTPTVTPTETPATPTFTSTLTPTETPATPVVTPTFTPTETPSTPVATPTFTRTDTPATPVVTPTITPTDTPATPVVTPATPTITPSPTTSVPAQTVTPTRTETQTPTPDVLYLDDDSCAIVAPEQLRHRRGLLWILLPALVWVARRRSA